jgi:antitoxin Phd
MPTRFSIAQARQNLARLVHQLEHKPVIELTRRGEPVAVLLSIQAYRRLRSHGSGFWAAYEAFRRQARPGEITIEPDTFDGVRDRSSGREARL